MRVWCDFIMSCYVQECASLAVIEVWRVLNPKMFCIWDGVSSLVIYYTGGCEKIGILAVKGMSSCQWEDGNVTCYHKLLCLIRLIASSRLLWIELVLNCYAFSHQSKWDFMIKSQKLFEETDSVFCCSNVRTR